jgi:hypothetical protein
MFNLDYTFFQQDYYLRQKDFYTKGVGYGFGAFGFLDLLRGQVPEMNILQLIPGFYLVLIFIAFLVLFNLSNLLISLVLQVDIRKGGGLKTTNRMEVALLVKIGFLIFSLGIIVSFDALIPLSFDSLDAYGKTTLEDVWSLDELIGIETFLLFFLVILSQVPIVALIQYECEYDAIFLPEVWKQLSVLSFLFAGVITPSVDAFTQSSFAAGALTLYVLVIGAVQKRTRIKYLETHSLF